MPFYDTQPPAPLRPWLHRSSLGFPREASGATFRRVQRAAGDPPGPAPVHPDLGGAMTNEPRDQRPAIRLSQLSHGAG